MSNQRLIGISLAIIVGITILTFLPAINAEFTNWDDQEYVYDNPYIKGLSLNNLKNIVTKPVSGNYHPLTMLSLSLDYNLFGPNAEVFHRVNLLLHLINIVLVYGLIFFLSHNQFVAFLTALLFAIHPLHVEPVLWISSRKDLLYSSFYLAALICYMKHLKNPRRTFFFLTAILFLASILSKPQAASLPFLLLVLDWWHGRKINRQSIVEKWPFFILAVITGIVAYTIQLAEGSLAMTTHYSLWQKILFVNYAFMMYIIKFLFPFHLSSFYPYPDQFRTSIPLLYYISILFNILIIAGALKLLKRSREFALGLLFFVTTIFLLLKFVPVGGFVMAERYTYLPYIGLAFILSTFIQSKWELTRAGYTVLAAVCLILCLMSFQRAQIWSNSLTLWADVIRKYPELPIAYHNRGLYYANAENLDKALEDFNTTIELHPNFATAYLHRGNIYTLKNQSQKALTDLDQAIELDPNLATAYNDRAALFSKTGQWDNAWKDLKKAEELAPDWVYVYLNKGKYLKFKGDIPGALREYAKALSLDPSLVEGYLARGKIYVQSKQTTKAISDFTQAIAIDPRSFNAYLNRGSAYSFNRQYSHAIRDFTEAIRLKPDSAVAFYNRGSAYRLQGNVRTAIKDYSQAIKLNPYYGLAYSKRSVAYKKAGNLSKAYRDAIKARELGQKITEEYLNELKK